MRNKTHGKEPLCRQANCLVVQIDQMSGAKRPKAYLAEPGSRFAVRRFNVNTRGTAVRGVREAVSMRIAAGNGDYLYCRVLTPIGNAGKC